MNRGRRYNSRILPDEFLYPNFLTNKKEYEDCEKYWKKFAKSLFGEKFSEFEPWYINEFANGAKIYDGNPIFSLINRNTDKAIRIIQHQPHSLSVSLCGWIEKKLDHEKTLNVLTVVLELKESLLQQLRTLIKDWFNNNSEEQFSLFLDNINLSHKKSVTQKIPVEEDIIEREKKIRLAQERIKKLKEITLKMKSPEGLAALEKQTAFERKNIIITNTKSYGLNYTIIDLMDLVNQIIYTPPLFLQLPKGEINIKEFKKLLKTKELLNIFKPSSIMERIVKDLGGNTHPDENLSNKLSIMLHEKSNIQQENTELVVLLRYYFTFVSLNNSVDLNSISQSSYKEKIEAMFGNFDVFFLQYLDILFSLKSVSERLSNQTTKEKKRADL